MKIEGSLSGVPIKLVENPEAMSPGWYYTLPIPEDLKAHRDEICYAGPYTSQIDAALGAVNFVTEAITDYVAEGTDVQPPPRSFAVFLNPDPDFVPRDPDDDMA